MTDEIDSLPARGTDVSAQRRVLDNLSDDDLLSELYKVITQLGANTDVGIRLRAIAMAFDTRLIIRR